MHEKGAPARSSCRYPLGQPPRSCAVSGALEYVAVMTGVPGGADTVGPGGSGGFRLAAVPTGGEEATGERRDDYGPDGDDAHGSSIVAGRAQFP